jgi:hypothetical protein
VSQCHTYNFFEGSSSTYDQSNFQENCSNLADDCNLNILDVNLSLVRAEEQSNNDSTVMELSDDQDEQDDDGPYDSSEVETGEDYTELSDFSNDESENEEIQRCDNIFIVIGRTERQHPVEVLNNFWDVCLGANKYWLRHNDKLAENRIFTSKSV